MQFDWIHTFAECETDHIMAQHSGQTQPITKYPNDHLNIQIYFQRCSICQAPF